MPGWKTANTRFPPETVSDETSASGSRVPAELVRQRKRRSAAPGPFTIVDWDSSAIGDEKAGVGPVPGASYGPGGEAFMRFNLAYPKSILEQGLERIAAAVDAL